MPDERILTTEEVERLLEGTTPGPWSFTRKSAAPYWATIEAESGHIADVQFWRDGYSENDAESKANAPLIAAAPQLAADYLTLRAERDRLLAERERLQKIVETARRVVDVFEDDHRSMKDGHPLYPVTCIKCAALVSWDAAIADAQQERT